MGRLEKQERGGALYRPAKGETANPRGRPRKYVSALRAQGYTISEVNDCIQVMLAMTLDELKAVYTEPKATVLEKTVASAIRKSIEKGSLYSIETLLSRVYGKPREQTEITGGVTIHTIKLGKK